MVLTDSDRISRVPPYLGYPLASLPVSSTGLSPCVVGLSMPFNYKQRLLTAAPLPRLNCLIRFGLVPVRSPLLGESLLFSSPPGTEMFHFPGFASRTYVFSTGYSDITRKGFPHSDISGS